MKRLKNALAAFCVWLLGLSKCTFVEQEAKRYRLKNKTWFYKGTMPTINESQIHTPNVLITPPMVLVLVDQTEKYLEFEIVINYYYREGEVRRDGELVYYKKELFDNLDKIEL